MKLRKRWIVAGAVAVLAVGGTAVAVAGGGDDQEAPITGDARRRASNAALTHTGGGRVTDTEIGDEDAYYEVEVTKPGGGQVDVHLDRQFKVQSEKADVEGADDADESEGSQDSSR